MRACVSWKKGIKTGFTLKKIEKAGSNRQPLKRRKKKRGV